MTAPAALPEAFETWFQARGWRPHPHQIEMLTAAREGQSALLIAPTGGGKTLAGFLPSLAELAEDPQAGLHTLYISPLKALAVDIHRNLTQPLEEMGLPVTVETRTGDTPHSKRQRQRRKPPNLLLTTPESLALLLSYPDAPEVFARISCVVIDELHALYNTKRGELLALGLSRLQTINPALRRVGLSATVHDPEVLHAWLSPQGKAGDPQVRRVLGRGGAEPQVEILTTKERLPWAGHMAAHAVPEVYERIKRAGTTLVFVNTRAQAEIVFQELWRLNEEALPIALHHGSLAVEQRRKVESAMARGALRAVVATSSLDLGIDWAAVDLVIQIGAPKGVSRLLQRLGRANHRLDQPSKALLVPANRFEVLECRAAADGVREGTLDGDPARPGGLDVLAQHILGRACCGPFDADRLYGEIVGTAPYGGLSRKDFDDTLAFVATGGYALKGYERYRRLAKGKDGLWRLTHLKHMQRYRMNVGTIVEAPVVKVRLRGGRTLGEVEEYFVNGLVPGDSFLFAGQLLVFEGLRENAAIARRGGTGEPKIPAYAGGKLPLTTHLAERVRAILESPRQWKGLPEAVEHWLELQRWASVLPPGDGLLIESFPRGGKQFTVAYCFAGRNAHQTLGMLLTRRMERAGLGPLGFVATDYVIAVWSLKPVEDADALFDQDMLGDDLEAWMAESSLLRRTFRNVAIISGLIERRLPGQEKSGKQVTFSADLIYDVLRKYEPEHILLRATRADAARGLTDVERLGELLIRVQGRILHRRLDRVSPLAVPILLEIGREQVYGSALEEILGEGETALIEEASAGRPAQGALPI
ncbi:MAG: ligase-associated DNA damage response DEXH box helicase [Rhodovibrionaceae bacterium]